MILAVTGATGQLGCLVLESLLERGTAPENIVAIGRATEKLADFEVVSFNVVYRISVSVSSQTATVTA